jgi:hypothetical protein
MRSSPLTLIGTRFPTLKVVGQRRVRKLKKADELIALLRQLVTISDEEDARSLLTPQ